MNDIKLIAFDLDGTVTQHKSKICSNNKAILKTLAKKYKILFVGAGSCNRINDQLDGFNTDIIGFYGMEEGKYNSITSSFEILEKIIVPVNKEEIEKKINIIRNKYDFIKFEGESVEFHKSGMITFPLLGTKAKLVDKLKFDPKRIIRRKIYEEVCLYFEDYNVVIGGTSSFDIVPKPYTKLNALEKYCYKNNINIDDIMYVGDDYEVGGNDESIYKSNIKFICINDYRQLGDILSKNKL